MAVRLAPLLLLPLLGVTDAQLSYADGCDGSGNRTRLFLPSYAFYGPRHNYSARGVLILRFPEACFSPQALLAPPRPDARAPPQVFPLASGQHLCDTSTWGPLRGRVVLLSGALGSQCDESNASVPTILKNISAAGGSSITYWPFPASGYFALRRFAGLVDAQVFDSVTPHTTVGNYHFKLLMSVFGACSVQRQPTFVTLLPEEHTHIDMYEHGGGVVISWFTFVLSYLLLSYVFYVTWLSTHVLRTCRTATHLALGLDALCCLHRSTCCGPFGFAPFSYVFNSSFNVSWVQSSNIYGPLSTVILVFRMGAIMYRHDFSKSQSFAFYLTCFVICATMCAITVWSEVVYAYSPADKDKLAVNRAVFTFNRSFSASLYAVVCVPLLLKLYASAKLMHDNSEQKTAWARLTGFVSSITMKASASHNKLLTFFRRFLITSALHVWFSIWATVVAFTSQQATTGELLGDEANSSADYYHSWIENITTVWFLDFFIIAIETYCFHLSIIARVVVREDPQLKDQFKNTSVRWSISLPARGSAESGYTERGSTERGSVARGSAGRGSAGRASAERGSADPTHWNRA
ncbi:hypothetical protein AB1Y20_016911 [Prymnesium parvum]|uniref:Uncharacterized protein n=1 Tax=Prymnesium parvum TaxID=97485 RepID=A0AB34ICI5_PRYPA